uniref:DRBM domain-containing protein n=1 Tax=Timema douglasi TaxID=61478 RepID=A0A7R8VJD5_TIMDO|nr:unnamed protein product [Timema douglasi]
MARTLIDLKKDKTFHSLKESIEANHRKNKEEVQLLDKEAKFEKNVRDLNHRLIAGQNQGNKKANSCLEKIAHLKDLFHDAMLQGRMEMYYIKQWEKSRQEQNEMRSNKNEQELTARSQRLAKLKQSEQRANAEVMAYLESAILNLELKINEWIIFYERSIEEKDESLLILTIEKERNMIRKNELQKLYDEHKEEINKYLKHRELKRQEIERKAFINSMATRLQTWWRGIMYRHKLERNSPRKKKKAKKDRKNKSLGKSRCVAIIFVNAVLLVTGVGQSKVLRMRCLACMLPFLYMGLFLQLVRCAEIGMMSDVRAPQHACILSIYHLRGKMSSNAVGCLQEFCMKYNFNFPTYLVTNESGSPHAKIFTVTCQVGDHVTTALQPNPGAEYKDHDNASANKLPSLDGVNTVGRLQEMAQAKKWKMPLYQERGTINSLQCVKCTFQDITTEGWSTTKKEAKKKAAAEMLAQLNVSQSFGSTSPLGSPITSTTTSASEITNPTIVDVFNIPVSDHLIDLGITTDNEVSLNITTEEMVNTQATFQEKNL